MKRFSIVFITLLILIVNMITALAGDVPECLLSDDSAQIFFAELVSVDLFGDGTGTTVKPVKKVKGDVSVGEEKIYQNPEFVGDFNAKAGNVYLFAYTDEANPLYIFEVDSYDTGTLKITGVSGQEMWERFLGYLHDGDYEAAEKERLAAAGIAETEEITELPPIKSYNLEIYGVISIGVAAIAFFIWTKVSKKKI